MALTTLTVPIDTQLLQKAEHILAKSGMNLEQAFIRYLEVLVLEGRSPIRTDADPFYCEQNLARLAKAASDMDAGINVTGR